MPKHSTFNYVNLVVLSGFVGGDPSAGITKDGIPFVKFNVGVRTLITTKSGRRLTETTWVPVVAWNNLAIAVEDLCKKGSYVHVVGRLSKRVWGDENERRSHVYVNCLSFSLLSLSQAGEGEAISPEENVEGQREEDSIEEYGNGGL